MAAILFKIEAAHRLGYTRGQTCTEVACQWNDDFVESVEYKRIKDIMFYKSSTKSSGAKKETPPATSDEQESLLQALNRYLFTPTNSSSKGPGLSVSVFVGDYFYKVVLLLLSFWFNLFES